MDTASGYQAGVSETLIGDWLAQRQNRDEMVIATKYSMSYLTSEGHRDTPIRINCAGNGRKTLRLSLEQSLLRLRTGYVDILYVHFWDGLTSVAEVMRSLHDMVTSGRVLYLGISDTPAWIVVKANAFARQHGLTPFSVYQGHWSLLCRDMERELIPMAFAEQMAIVPFGVLGKGKYKTPTQLEEGRKAGLRMRSFWGKSDGEGDGGLTEQERRVSEALSTIARKRDLEHPSGDLGSIALAYHLTKYPYVFPVIGIRTSEQIESAERALEMSLSKKEQEELEGAAPFQRGFPFEDYGGDPTLTGTVESYMIRKLEHPLGVVKIPEVSAGEAVVVVVPR